MGKIAKIVLGTLSFLSLWFGPRENRTGGGGLGNTTSKLDSPKTNRQLIKETLNKYLDIAKEGVELGDLILSLLDRHKNKKELEDKDKKELEEIRKRIEKLEEHTRNTISKAFNITISIPLNSTTINSQLIEKTVNEHLDIAKEWKELSVAIISLLDKHKDKKELEEIRKHVEKLEEHTRKAINEQWFENSVLSRSHVQSLPSDFGNTSWQSQ